MRIIEPSAHISGTVDRVELMRHLERCARKCYKSECKITDNIEDTNNFIRKLVNVKKHESVIEHVSVTVDFIVDRGVSHELVRHRIAAFSQESTRYCNYSQDKFGNELTFIRPLFWNELSAKYAYWKLCCQQTEDTYNELIACGASPQEARSVLPNSLKTELAMTCNMREWRHIFRMRTSSAAHPQMRQVMIPLLEEFKLEFSPLFEDIEIK